MTFTENKYYNWYNNLIKKSLTRTLDGYCERHHILPKCFGGTNGKENIVRLTAREHLIAHLLLTKCTEGIERKKMVRAAVNMSCHKGNRINSRIYEQLRLEFSKNQTGRKLSPHQLELLRVRNSGSGNPFYGKTHSEETKQKLKELNAGKHAGKKNQFFGKTHSDETKQKVAIANSTRIWKEESKQKLREKLCGRKISIEWRNKISAALKGKPKSEEHKKNLRLSQLNKNKSE